MNHEETRKSLLTIVSGTAFILCALGIAVVNTVCNVTLYHTFTSWWTVLAFVVVGATLETVPIINGIYVAKEDDSVDVR